MTGGAISAEAESAAEEEAGSSTSGAAILAKLIAAGLANDNKHGPATANFVCDRVRENYERALTRPERGSPATRQLRLELLGAESRVVSRRRAVEIIEALHEHDLVLLQQAGYRVPGKDTVERQHGPAVATKDVCIDQLNAKCQRGETLTHEERAAVEEWMRERDAAQRVIQYKMQQQYEQLRAEDQSLLRGARRKIDPDRDPDVVGKMQRRMQRHVQHSLMRFRAVWKL